MISTSAKKMLVKVPAITAYFWIIKVHSTTVGETFADYLNNTLGFGLAKTSLVMSGALVIALIFRLFGARKRLMGSRPSGSVMF